MVDQNDIGAGRAHVRRGLCFFRRFGLVVDEAAQLLALTDAEVGRRIELRALLRERTDDLEPKRLRELAQLGERGLEFDVARARQLHRRHDGAFRRFPCLLQPHGARSLSGRDYSVPGKFGPEYQVMENQLHGAFQASPRNSDSIRADLNRLPVRIRSALRRSRGMPWLHGGIGDDRRA
jgi:hypothetical protein